MNQQLSVVMPSHVIERVMQKRGRMRIFDRFEPSKTALVIIDMQSFYVDVLPTAIQIIPTINRLAAEFRQRGAHVAWVSMTAGRDGKSLWPLYHEYFFSADNGARHRDGLTPGNPGHELHPQLDVQPEDIQASKDRFSAFFPSACNLHEQLVQLGIENVAIGGVVTNFCCETSARDAMMLDYRVAMVTDANAARYPEDHQVGFTTVFQSFGDVLTSDELLDEVLR